MSMIKIILALVFIAALAVLSPFLLIWSMNTLFPVLSIPYTIETWASVIILQVFVKASITYKRDKNSA